MTTEEQTLIDIQELISGLPEDVQIQVDKHAEYIRTMIKLLGPAVLIAIALIGAEYAAKGDES